MNDNEILKIALDIRHPNLVFADADWICCVTSVKIQQMDGETSRVTMSPLVKKMRRFDLIDVTEELVPLHHIL